MELDDGRFLGVLFAEYRVELAVDHQQGRSRLPADSQRLVAQIDGLLQVAAALLQGLDRVALELARYATRVLPFCTHSIACRRSTETH